MTTLFDIYGFVSVLVHGLDLVAQTVLVGSVLFELLIDVRGARQHETQVSRRDDMARRTIAVAALATMVTTAVATALSAAILRGTLDLPSATISGSRFVIEGAARFLAATAILAIVLALPMRSAVTRAAIGVLALSVLVEAAANSHAAARLDHSAVLYGATFAHQLGAALWLGGLPCLRAALLRAGTPAARQLVARRYSAISICGVLLILAGAVIFAIVYIGSWNGAYGTAYGAMAITKSVLLGLLLLLGLHNFRAARSTLPDAASGGRVVRIVTIEMGVGFAVLMAAASITSTPPAVDLVDDRVTSSELAERWRPTVPQLHSPDHASLMLPALQAELDAQWRARQASTRPMAFVPGAGIAPPRNAFDIAWSEYNHHWAGILVLAMGLAALLAHVGWARWARHWPLLFVGLALFVFLRGDPEVWPLGEIGLVESLRDPEVVQHRLFVLLMIGFAVFEWRVQTGRNASPRAARVFPLLVALGATLLLTHSHSLGNVKEELLIETTHSPIAVLGVVAGWSRWLEVEAPRGKEGRFASWVWPWCFLAIGLLLLGYREA